MMFLLIKMITPKKNKESEKRKEKLLTDGPSCPGHHRLHPNPKPQQYMPHFSLLFFSPQDFISPTRGFALSSREPGTRPPLSDRLLLPHFTDPSK
jgi:hypothetical protein